MRTKRILALLLSAVLLLGIMPITTIAAEMPIPVTTEGRTFSLFTEDNLEDQFGTIFLYVVEKDGRYYTPSQPDSVSDFEYFDSVAAIDITDYWNSATNTFSDIPDSLNVGAFEYQSNPFPGDYGSYVFFIDEDIMFSLRVPSENSGETWFEGGLCYADREQYLYRPIWESLGDGKGYLLDSQYDQNEDGSMVFGVLALKGTDRFALKNMSDEYNADESIDVNAYLYASPCNHPTTDHSYYVAPTCMDKGCEEYWHCAYCQTYFKNAEYTEAYKCRPVIPALGHDYGDSVCENCNSPIPQYTKITSYEQFRTIEEGASFIVVAELDDGNGGKEYYALKEPVNFVSSDIDEDGDPDILHIDDDANGTPDVLELDKDGDGVADVYAWDGFIDEPDGILDDMEIEEYLFELEREYTNGYMVYNREVESVKVDPEKDGTISVKDMGVLEFIMERKIPDSLLGDQYYGNGATIKDYENDFMFRIPNFWVRPMITIDNNFYQMPYEQGDSKWWGILFGKDVKELRPEFFEGYPDDAAVIYTEAFDSFNLYGETEYAIRFLVNGDKKTFIITSEFYYGEEIVGTQIPVYLYSSDAGGEIHEHIWGDWASYNDESHRRFCTVDGCSDFEIALHDTTGTEYIPDAENYELGHWVTCCICNGQIHEYHTMEMVPPRNVDEYWRDTADGVHHVVNCTKCLGPVEYGEHRWYDWYAGSKEIDGEWVMGHYTSCKDWPCEASKWQADCLYDEGTVTLEPTCTEKGIITYTCTAESCSLETRVYTEEIPALEHDWGDWTVSSTDPTKEERICNNDNSHVEERPAHEHDWTAWAPDEENNGHSRSCIECGATETETHNWGNGEEVTPPTCEEPGVISYACPDCGAIISEETDNLGHEWSDWEYDSVDSHIRHCKRENCNAEDFGGHEWGDWTTDGADTHTMECPICNGSQTEDHEWDNGKIIEEPTCTEKGVITFTCKLCSDTKTEDIPVIEHEFGDWTPNVDDKTHSRVCECGESETEDHNFDNGEVLQAPTHEAVGEIKYTCVDCGFEYIETMPIITDHIWSEWVVNKVDEANTHIRFCFCNESQTAPHNFDEGKVIEEATHTAKGVKTFTCEDCGYSYDEEIPAIADHVWTDWSPNDDGTHTRACRCNATETKDCEWDDGVITEKPTHTEPGTKTYTCTLCGNTISEEVPLLTDHEWSEWVVNKADEDNTHVRFCICGETKTAPHDFEDGICKDCGYTDPVRAEITNEIEELLDRVLTEEEKELLEEGYTVDIDLEVVDISDTVSEEEKELAEENAEAGDIACYLDINVYKTVNDGEPTKISETSGKIEISIKVPAEFIKDKIFYQILRIHDGKADLLDCEFDPETGRITFKTDKFSTYVLIVNDISEDGDCVYVTEEELDADGVYTMTLGGEEVGEFEFVAVDGGWTISDDGEYLAIENGKLVYSEKAFVWTFEDDMFSASETVVEEIKKGFWGGLFGGSDSTEIVETTTTYYLAVVEDELTASEIGDAAEFSVKHHDDKHSYDEGVVTKPTCTEKGYTTYTCEKCGEECVYNEKETIEHNYVDGECEDCGKLEDVEEPEEPEENCIYIEEVELEEDGSYILSIGGYEVGKYTVTAVDDGWTIFDEKDETYLAVLNGILVYTDEEFVWAYDEEECKFFYEDVKVVTTTNNFWGGLFGGSTSTETIVNVYYIVPEEDKLVVSEDDELAEVTFEVIVVEEGHEYVDGICENCGKCEDDTCVHFDAVELEENGEYVLIIGDEHLGFHTFENVDEDLWTIVNEDGDYVALEDGEIVYTSEEFVWTYDSEKSVFSVEIVTVATSGFWGGLFGGNTSTKVETYYLVAEDGNLAVSLKDKTATAEFLVEVEGEHEYGDMEDYYSFGRSFCENCGTVKFEIAE